MNGIWTDENTFRAFAEGDPITGGHIATSAVTELARLGDLLPNPDPVLKSQGQDIEVYSSLLTDSHVGAVVDKLVDGVCEMEYEVDRGRAKSRTARFMSDWLRDFDMRTFTEDVINARLMGYQPIEVIWEHMGNLLMPDEVVAKPQKWFGFSRSGELLLRTLRAPQGEPVPERNFLVPRYKKTYTNPYGFPVLSRAFWWVTFKRGGVRFYLNFIEKFGTPKVKFLVPANTDLNRRRELLRVGRQLIQDAVAVLNDNERAEIMEPAGKSASGALYTDLLNFCNTEISKGITSETLTTQLGDTGSYAASNTHAEILATARRSCARLVTTEMNKLFRYIQDTNFGSGDRPQFVMYEQNDVDMPLAERDKTLKETGIDFTPVYYVRKYGLAEDEFRVRPPASTAGTTFADNNRQAEAETRQVAAEALGTAPATQDYTAIAGELLEPVLAAIRSGNDYTEVTKKIATLYPRLSSQELQEKLTQVLFIADIIGRQDAR